MGFDGTAHALPTLARGHTRVRAACVNYMQNWLISFYPQRPDLVGKC